MEFYHDRGRVMTVRKKVISFLNEFIQAYPKTIGVFMNTFTSVAPN